MNFVRLDAIRNAVVVREPYPYLVAHGVLAPETMTDINNDFPDIPKAGFFPLLTMKRQGAFDRLLSDLESPALAALLTEKFGVDIRGKPQIITVRKWSAAKDGRIHNDGEAKVINSLLYLNPSWPGEDAGGRFRVLRSDKGFDDMAAEVSPDFGTFLAFVRTDNSWHGHPPFVGERRVIQASWLRNMDDYKRKETRGRLSLFFKKILSSSH
jgi:SM-20-related protein